MASSNSSVSPIDIVPGVVSAVDASSFANFQTYTLADKIRFYNGKPKKIGGWSLQIFEDAMSILGKVRSIFTTRFGNRVQAIIGSNLRLYNLYGSILTNITPLLTTTTTIANSIDTHYATLGSDPISVAIGSSNLTITDSEFDKFQVGDSVTISGATGLGGILAGAINGTRVIRAIGIGNYTIRAATAATSNATGGGASVVRTSGLLTFAATTHNQINGDRVKITLSADTGGVLAAEINVEAIIRNVATNSFDVMTNGTATSSVTGGGGASTAYQKQIPGGAADESFGQGYGLGLYGDGLYGVSKTSTSGRILPRIWFMDRFADVVVMTAGEQTGVYQWDGSTTVAPVLVANAPTAVNYSFISDSILVTFGAGGVPNKIFSSDVNDITAWTASSLNYVFEDNLEGADRLISHLPVAGVNLVFCENRTYTMRFIDLPFVWEFQLLDQGIGITGPMARVTVNGVGYWMGTDNFYQWSGGNIEPMGSNVGDGKKCTILNYVFQNFNRAQKSKCFAWYNRQFNEIWFHYPSAASNDPDRIARYHVLDRTWVMDTMDRTAAEYPAINLNNPLLASSETSIYKHELGTDADTAALPFSVSGPLFNKGGRDAVLITGVIPDALQTGDITLNIKTKLRPNSAVVNNKNYTVASTTDRVSTVARGRYWSYQWSGSALGQEWQMGNYQEEIQGAGKI